uniref:Uncharacterized protein n=1 Tax=Angiostrongylus cantonensis TaxID=6313 RepID=A0A0K0DJ64_ANGCA
MSLETDKASAPTTHNGDCFLLCTYNAETVTSDPDQYALLQVCGHFEFHAIAHKRRKARRPAYTSQMTEPSSFVARNFRYEMSETLALSCTDIIPN